MTHEKPSGFSQPGWFFTSLTLRFKRRSLRHRLLLNTEGLVPEEGQESIEFTQGQIVIFIREVFKRKKFITTHFFAVKTLQPEDLSAEIFGIHPGAKLLLKVTGESKIKRTIQFFERLQEKLVDLRAVPESVFIGIHSRNEANIPLGLIAEQVIHEQKIFVR